MYSQSGASPASATADPVAGGASVRPGVGLGPRPKEGSTLALTLDGPACLLLVEDNPGDARLVRGFLAEAPFAAGNEVVHATCLAEAVRLVSARQFTAALLDLGLPDSLGTDALARLHGLAPELPIVVFTGTDDDALGQRLVNEGAQDYLVKGEVDARGVRRSLRHAVERQQLMSAMEMHARAKEAGEARLRTLLEANLDGMLVLDGTNLVRFANPAARHLLGRDPAGAICRQFAGLDWNDGGVRDREIVDGQGSHRHVAVRKVDTEWEDEAASLVILHDITERKRAEQQLERINIELEERVAERTAALSRLNRVHRTLSECNQALVRARDEQRLFDAICRIIVKIGGYRLAWVGMLQDNTTCTVLPVASAGRHRVYLNDLRIECLDDALGRGPTGRAIRTGRVQIVGDIPGDPDFGPWRQAAVTQGFQSSIALPLIWGGRPRGALNIYSGLPAAFDATEQDLLRELAGDVSYGIANLRIQAARERAEMALRHSEETVRLLLDSTGEAIYGQDLDGRCTFANPACLRLLGYQDVSAMIGRETHALMHQRHADGSPYPAADCPVCHAAHEGIALRICDEVFWRVDGTSFPVEYSAHPIRRNGEVVGAVVAFQDISARRHAEETMRKLSAAVEQSNDLVLITGRDGRIEYANPAFVHTSGYQLDELIGQEPGIVSSGLHGAEFYQRMWTALEAGEVFQDTFMDRSKGGALFYVQATIAPIKAQAGEIVHFLYSGKNVTELMQKEARLYHAVSHDPLTDLPNRQLFLDRLDRILSRSEREKRGVAVLVFNLDRFKRINESLGHRDGDRLLQQIAERLKEGMRRSDHLARIGENLARTGGDEFGGVLEGVDDIGALSGIGARMRDNLGQVPFMLGDREVFVTASIGISTFPDDGSDAAELLRSAAMAMQRAKQSGGNRHQFFTDSMNTSAAERLSLETALRRAVEREEFLLHYQPQVDLASGKVVGVEALLRWQHPARGLIPPADFIPMLEETCLIEPVGEWVLRTACAQQRRWVEQGLAPLRMAVNLSVVQFRDPGLAGRVSRILAETGLEPGYLELEITESTAMQGVDDGEARLQELHELGVRLSLDDFGTGYSSLEHLVRFQMDSLKIDRGFVGRIDHNPSDRELAKAILMLARSIRLESVGEGVETDAHRAFLRDHGCTYGQGYLFSRPLPADALFTFCREC